MVVHNHLRVFLLAAWHPLLQAQHLLGPLVLFVLADLLQPLQAVEALQVQLQLLQPRGELSHKDGRHHLLEQAVGSWEMR